MDTNTRSAIISGLWNDVNGAHLADQKLFLAHYTTLESLEKIMVSNQIWFSHPFLMNDHEEVQYGINEGTRAILNATSVKASLGSEAAHQQFLERFMFFRSHYEKNFLFNTYVFCFSKHDVTNDDGRLSMWRGYGGDGTGAALIFDTSKLNNQASSPLIIDKVHYLSKLARQEWIAIFIARICRVSQEVLDEAGRTQLAQLVFERIAVAAIFSKHQGFEEEAEYRAVYMPDRDPECTFHGFFSYHNGPRGLEPKLKLKIEPFTGILSDDLSLEKLIHHVILGPSRASPLVRETTVRMLRAAGKHKLAESLALSQIPYRSLR